MFDDALKIFVACEKMANRVVPYQCVNPFILPFEAVISLHGGIFTKYSVSAGSEGKATLMSGVAKKQFSRHDRPFLGGLGAYSGPRKFLQFTSSWIGLQLQCIFGIIIDAQIKNKRFKTTVPFVTAHLEMFHCTHHPVIPKSDLYFTFCSTLNPLSKRTSK